YLCILLYSNKVDRDKCNWTHCCENIEKGLYDSHMSFHLYHTYLKFKGENYLLNKTIKNSKLCQRNSINQIPPVDKWYYCDWLNCAEMFGNIIDFVDHVNKSHAINCCSSFCLWKDCNSNKKMNVYKHINTHTHHKLVACPYCGYMFSTNQRLVSHLSNIDTTKKFECNICQKIYFTLQNLNIHKKYKHCDERKFTCNMCDHGSKSSSDLKLHKKNMHQ
ncbi:hypothetical protein A3Q56_06172, partial [Intoshia linei]